MDFLPLLKLRSGTHNRCDSKVSVTTGWHNEPMPTLRSWSGGSMSAGAVDFLSDVATDARKVCPAQGSQLGSQTGRPGGALPWGEASGGCVTRLRQRTLHPPCTAVVDGVGWVH